jgi:hypothetical protein
VGGIMSNKENIEKVSKDEKTIDHLAKENGLLSLTISELRILADAINVSLSGKKTKEEIASEIMQSGDNATLYCLEKPVGYVKVRKVILGYKPNKLYLVDKKTRDFLVKCNAIVPY